MTELIKPVLELIQQYGSLAFVLALSAVVFIMFSRTWTKQRDAQTDIVNNANDAQEMINKEHRETGERIQKLEVQNGEQAASITALQSALAATKWELTNARQEILGLQKKLVELEADKSALAVERDQLRSELNTAKGKIQDLEREVFKLRTQLQVEHNVQETVVNPLLKILREQLPVRTGDTGPLDAAKVPSEDPAALHMGDSVTLGTPLSEKKEQ